MATNVALVSPSSLLDRFYGMSDEAAASLRPSDRVVYIGHPEHGRVFDLEFGKEYTVEGIIPRIDVHPISLYFQITLKETPLKNGGKLLYNTHVFMKRTCQLPLFPIQ